MIHRDKARKGAKYSNDRKKVNASMLSKRISNQKCGLPVYQSVSVKEDAA